MYSHSQSHNSTVNSLVQKTEVASRLLRTGILLIRKGNSEVTKKAKGNKFCSAVKGRG